MRAALPSKSTLIAAAITLLSHTNLSAQAPSMPVLPDSTAISMARSALDSEISMHADVYVWRQGHFVRAVTGTNGYACLVSWSGHVDNLSPMCFDPVGARTLMAGAMLWVELLVGGAEPSSALERVNAAFADGRLHYPETTAVTYMMSPRQVLFSPSGRPQGNWYSHVMFYLPNATREQFALIPDQVFLGVPYGRGVELMVVVPNWAH